MNLIERKLKSYDREFLKLNEKLNVKIKECLELKSYSEQLKVESEAYNELNNLYKESLIINAQLSKSLHESKAQNDKLRLELENATKNNDDFKLKPFTTHQSNVSLNESNNTFKEFESKYRDRLENYNKDISNVFDERKKFKYELEKLNKEFQHYKNNSEYTIKMLCRSENELHIKLKLKSNELDQLKMKLHVISQFEDYLHKMKLKLKSPINNPVDQNAMETFDFESYVIKNGNLFEKTDVDINESNFLSSTKKSQKTSCEDVHNNFSIQSAVCIDQIIKTESNTYQTVDKESSKHFISNCATYVINQTPETDSNKNLTDENYVTPIIAKESSQDEDMKKQCNFNRNTYIVDKSSINNSIEILSDENSCLSNISNSKLVEHDNEKFNIYTESIKVNITRRKKSLSLEDLTNKDLNQVMYRELRKTEDTIIKENDEVIDWANAPLKVKQKPVKLKFCHIKDVLSINKSDEFTSLVKIDEPDWLNAPLTVKKKKSQIARNNSRLNKLDKSDENI